MQLDIMAAHSGAHTSWCIVTARPGGLCADQPRRPRRAGAKRWRDFTSRIWKNAPADNMDTAKKLVVELEKAKQVRDGSQKLAWIVCDP